MAIKENVLTKTDDLLIWFLPKIEKFPRNYRFLFGDRIVETFLDLLENLIEAYYSRNKIANLRAANVEIEKLRHLLKICTEMRFISLPQLEFATRALNEIGGMVGGWAKQQMVKDQRSHRPYVMAGQHSFEYLTSFENLYDAERKARRGKRSKDAVARFGHRLAENLVQLRDELRY